MDTTLPNKSSIQEIKERFDNDVERFSNLDTGQQATIDAPLAMELITQAAVTNTPAPQNILDIGCGAGNNTLKLLDQVTPSSCDLVDLSQSMLERAEGRISERYDGAITTYQSDFRTQDLPAEHYDIIIAAAVLHHLRDDRDWEQTFQKLYSLTAPGGSIWITDLVTHESDEVQQMMWSRYGRYLESLGGTEYREKVFRYIDQEDSPRPVTYQLKLLREAGFQHIDLLHKNLCFAAFGAVKAK